MDHITTLLSSDQSNIEQQTNQQLYNQLEPNELRKLAFWYQLTFSSITVFSGIITLLIIKKSGSFRFLSVNIILIIACEMIALGQILAKEYNAYYNIFDDTLAAIIIFYVGVAIFQALSYTTMNLLLWRVSFKYWETSR